LRRRKNRFRRKRRRRLFLQGSNTGKGKSGSECLKRQKGRTKARFDRGEVIFNGRNV
jgi:hypothetical protein